MAMAPAPTVSVGHSRTAGTGKVRAVVDGGEGTTPYAIGLLQGFPAPTDASSLPLPTPLARPSPVPAPLSATIAGGSACRRVQGHWWGLTQGTRDFLAMCVCPTSPGAQLRGGV